MSRRRRNSLWKLRSRLSVSPSAARVELLTAGLRELGEQRGKQAGADWAQANITTERGARNVLYALHRSYPPEEKDVFVSYDWSRIQDDLPHCPVVVDVEVGADEYPILDGEAEFDEVLRHLRIPRYRASDREDVHVALAAAYCHGWNSAMEAEVVGHAENLANLGAVQSRDVLRSELDLRRGR